MNGHSNTGELRTQLETIQAKGVKLREQHGALRVQVEDLLEKRQAELRQGLASGKPFEPKTTQSKIAESEDRMVEADEMVIANEELEEQLAGELAARVREENARLRVQEIARLEAVVRNRIAEVEATLTSGAKAAGEFAVSLAELDRVDHTAAMVLYREACKLDPDAALRAERWMVAEWYGLAPLEWLVRAVVRAVPGCALVSVNLPGYVREPGYLAARDAATQQQGSPAAKTEAGR